MTNRSTLPILISLLVAAVVAASCSSSETASPVPATTDSPSDQTTSTPSPVTEAPQTTTSPQTTSAPPPSIVDDAELDWSLPSTFPTEPTGSLGFSRYVFVRDDSGSIIPVVVEGTRDGQNRCQDIEQTCSYQELKALFESGDDLPAHLAMTRTELGELVSQLDQNAATVNSLPTPADACAAGYLPVSAQNPNMGIHFVNAALLADGFDPGNPEMLLYASESGLGLGRSDIGTCGDGGTWDGIDDLRVTGSAFFIDLSDEHPDGFAGTIDQWHVHYNSCANGEFDSTASVSLCDQNGGAWFDLQPNWMMHSYVADGFDSDTGVFGMWNNSIWPIAEPGAGASAPADATTVAIDQFAFGKATVQAGDTVWFANNDEIPHVVVAGTPANPLADFASPIIANGEAWEVTLDQPGSLNFYCSLHPSMVGTITVE